MCQRPLPLSLAPVITTRQKISSLSPEQLALKKKSDLRAQSLLRALAQFQINKSDPNLIAYPTLAAVLRDKRK